MDRFAQPTIADDRRAEALENCERARASANIAVARVIAIGRCMMAVKELADVCSRESANVASGYIVSEQQLDELRAIIGEHIDDAIEHITRDISQEV